MQCSLCSLRGRRFQRAACKCFIRIVKLEKSGKINAPINKVFECFTDIDFIKSEIARSKKHLRPKLHYDKKNPFGEGNKIIFNINGHSLVCEINECIKPSSLSVNVSISQFKDFFGSILCQVNLKSVKNKTAYNLVYVSQKTPTGILALIMKSYFWVSSISCFRRFNKYVQSNKNV